MTVEPHRSSRPTGVRLLAAALAVQGVSGLGGGGALLLDPSGAAIGLPVQLLEGSPFGSYLIPGLVLFAALGAAPLVVLWRVWTRRRWSPPAALLVGVALVVWIVVQILVVGYRADPPLQGVFGALGLGIVALALLPSVRRVGGVGR